MTELLTEQEQIEQIKNWLKQYGLTVVAGIVFALIIVSAWHYWDRYQNKILIHASGIYDEMLTLKAQNNTNEAAVQAKRLLSHYPKTPYAQMAAFTLARDAAIAHDYPEAINQLNWVASHTQNAPIRSIAKIRLARIYIAENLPEDALKQLKKINDQNFNGMVDEAKGDAYLLEHDTAKAKEAYQQGLQELPSDEETRKPIIQMKLDNLATASDAT